MLVGLNGETLEPALINMAYAGSPVCGMPSLRVGHRYPSHEFGDIAVANGPQQQMTVIPHDAVAAKTHLYTLKPLAKDTLERFEIRTFSEYPQPAVRTVENMINKTTRTSSLRPSQKYDN